MQSAYSNRAFCRVLTSFFDSFAILIQILLNHVDREDIGEYAAVIRARDIIRARDRF